MTGTGRRFALVGVVNTVIDFLLFAILGRAGVPVVLANMLSTSAGMTFSFLANRAWSFGSGRSVRQTIVPFLVITLVGLWVLHPLAIVATVGLLAPGGDEGDPVLWAGKAAAIAAGLVWNYTLYQHVVFRTGATR